MVTRPTAAKGATSALVALGVIVLVIAALAGYVYLTDSNKLADQSSELNGQASSISSLSGALGSAEASVAGLQATTASLGATTASYSSAIVSLQGQINNLAAQNNADNAEISGLNSKIGSLESPTLGVTFSYTTSCSIISSCSYSISGSVVNYGNETSSSTSLYFTFYSNPDATGQILCQTTVTIGAVGGRSLVSIPSASCQSASGTRAQSATVAFS